MLSLSESPGGGVLVATRSLLFAKSKRRIEIDLSG